MCEIPPELEEDMANLTFEEQGSKLALVSHLLHNLRSLGSEKIVIVSISTQVLDLLGELCTHYEYPFLRLDGSTSTNQRQVVVNRFNDRLGKDFVLLLSSKAGGTGKKKAFHHNLLLIQTIFFNNRSEFDWSLKDSLI